MERIKALVSGAVCVVLAGLLGGCGASYQARSVDLKSTLVNPDLLKEGTDDQALYRYRNPKVNIAGYTKVMIEPVMVAKDGELDADDQENYRKLANNAFVYLNEELKKDYQIVMSPEPNTMRLTFAIIDADTSKPVRNLFSSVMPIGIGISVLKYGATGKQSGVGEITGETKVTDAQTGELLAAALDRRVGGKAAKGIWDTWYNADEALKFWAKQVRWGLCTERKGTNCEKP
jgi:hypothetical protein